MANPWEIDWSQPQGASAPNLVPLPKQPAPQTPTQQALDQVSLQLKQKELAKVDGGPGALTSEDRGKFTRQRQGALGLKKRIAEVEQLYNEHFKGGGPGALIEYAPGVIRPVNEVFRNAGGGLMGDLAAAYGLSAQQQNTPTELEIRFGPFIPKPGDRDEVIEAKIRRLHEIADEQERQALDALGLSQNKQQINAPLPAQSVPLPPQGGAAPSAPEGPGLSFDPSGNAILEDRGGGLAAASSNGLHSESDPKMAGANAEINDLLKRGAPLGAIAATLRQRGAEPENVMGILKQAQAIKIWQKQNPGYKGDFNIDVERVQVPNSGFENFANSGLGVGLASAADAATGFNSDSIIGAMGGDPEDARIAMAAAQAAHPTASTIGTLAGGVGAAMGLEGLAGRAGLTGLARTGVADVGYGSGAGAGATDYAEDGSPASVGDRLAGAGKGALAAAVGGLAGQGVAATGRGLARSSRDPYVANLNADQVPLTVGQQYTGKLGGIIKRTEDRIAGLPVVGDIINARRLEGIKKFNENTFDHALSPIGVKIEGRVGEDAVDYAQDRISDAFNKALKGKAVSADPQFSSDLTKAVTKTANLPRVGGEVASGVEEILKPYMVGNKLSGESMQQISRELRDLKAGYRGDPMKKRIGDAIDEVEEAIFGPFRRQAPDVLPAYNKAKLAQRRLYTVADAVNAAKNKEGIFMPSQLGTADRNATKRMEGAVSAARGRGQFHDMQRAAQQVLPSQIPDSGTAGRIAIPAIALGVGGTSDASGVTNGAGTTLAGILALAYSRAGQRLLTKPGRGLSGKTGKVLQSEKTRKLLTAGGASSGVGLATQQ